MDSFAAIELTQSAIQRAFFAPILFGFIGGLAWILQAWQGSDRVQDRLLHMSSDGDQFDFIVVGAGSAGSIVAARLSEFYSVLLLEAGGEPHPLQSIPGFGISLLNFPELDWMHRTVPQKKSCLNSVNQQSSWSAGRNLGGTSNLNLLIQLRGHPKDFDNWANITGDSSWNYENVLPYFKKHEDIEGWNETADMVLKYHSRGGELHLERPDITGLIPDFISAAQELGYPRVDLNAYHTEGFDGVYYPTKRGVRQAVYQAFIVPNRQRRNLTIRKFSSVHKVLVRKSENLAYGVKYKRHGHIQMAFARKEIIVSAGTVTTPKLLMLSGIGPKAHLESLGIPVQADLPVGQNLQDHASVYVGPFFINESKTVLVDRDIGPSAFVDYFVNGKGYLTSTGSPATGVIASSYAKSRNESEWPDLHFILSILSMHEAGPQVLSRAFNLNETDLKKYYANSIGKRSFHIIVSGARPFSRGHVLLQGTNPRDKPLIDPKYLEDPDDIDVKVLAEGVKFAVSLVENTTTFEKLNGSFTTVKLPGCEEFEMRTDEYWNCYIRRYTVTLHHPVGTARMGDPKLPESVVDSQLRVIGIQGLRVIDASIQPYIVVTNTQASTMMIGEKGADMILKTWLNKT